ncbi:hypothetical protein EIP86_010593 [Pleurotus ostreatoroseus]|nr:hypothetical protein EIP86_010593 [Pleurotus ostreatoroseus]
MVPNVVESFLLLVTATTCILNALTQLLLNGAITKPLFGHAETLKPKWDEDFSVVLFRLGTASLEATSVAGYGNEVGGITRPRGDLVLGQIPAAPSETTVEISRSGFVSIIDGVDAQGRRIEHKRGFTNEIRQVKASSRNAEVWADTLVNVAWHREMARFMLGLWRTASSLGRMLWSLVWTRACLVADSGPAANPTNSEASSEREEARLESDVYERFLRGEDLSDEDDDVEFEPRSRHPTVASSSAVDAIDDEDDDASSEDDEGSPEDDGEAVKLYADLSQTASTSAAAPLLLAHMTDTSASPLTRRRYASLVRMPTADSLSSADDWSRYVQERRTAKRGRIPDEAFSESRQNCVICTVEPREILSRFMRRLPREPGVSFLRIETPVSMLPYKVSLHFIDEKSQEDNVVFSVEGYSKIYIP